MTRVQCKKDVIKTKIEAAHYAPIAVSAKHVFAELRIPFRLRCLKLIEPRRREDILMD